MATETVEQKIKLNKIHHGDCLELMKNIPDKSIDMILCDLPYGTTTCKWDSIIPVEPLWEQYERVIKDNGAIVLTASQPFTIEIINSKRNLFRYELIWYKTRPTGTMSAKRMPMKTHENILVFYNKQPTYNPQMVKRNESEWKRLPKKSVETKPTQIDGRGYSKSANREQHQYKYPRSVLEIKSVHNQSKEKVKHPTQKPVELFEYLIKTYTNEGETVLDNCIGSGTTAIACLNTNRTFIGIEKEMEYVDIANKRIESR